MSQKESILKRARRAAIKLKSVGLSQSSIDAHAGVPLNTTSKMLRDEKIPDNEKLKAISMVPAKIRRELK